MKDIVLYTNHCPKCEILKEKLNSVGFDYDIEDNVETLHDMGFTHMPMLKIDDMILSYKQAFEYIDGI